MLKRKMKKKINSYDTLILFLEVNPLGKLRQYSGIYSSSLGTLHE